MATPIYKEEDSPLLKEWIIKRLENRTDADADVLADYVLALLHHDVDEVEVRRLCDVELRPFLANEETYLAFISDVFQALENKTYLPPSRRPPIQKPAAPALGGLYDPSKPLEGFTPNQVAYPTQLAPMNGSRKRSYQERLDGEGHAAEPMDGQRHHKLARHGGFAMGRGDGIRNGLQRNSSAPYPASGAHMTVPGYPPGPPPALGAMPQSGQHPLPPNPYANTQGITFAPHFGAPGQVLGPHLPHGGGRGGKQRKKRRCREYDSKGVCSRGANCPFEHGAPLYQPLPPHLLAAYQQAAQMHQPPHVPPPPGVAAHQDDFDSNETEFILHAPNPQPPAFPYVFNMPRGGFRAPRGSSARRGRGKGRAAFSVEGPVNDQSQTTIVVENIPEEHFDEGRVREFFSQFGNIVEVTMRPYKRLALVKYDNWAAANAAWRSPKVIFDNRFVKVFWYNEKADLPPGSTAANPELGYNGVSNGSGNDLENGEIPVEPELDMEEFVRRQDEAQKAYEEKKRKREELERQRRELDQRQQELLKERLEVRQKLEEKLAVRARKTSPDGTVSSEDSGSKMTTEMLRAQLKKLEEEASILGLNPIKEDEPSHDFSASYPGFRGRGSFRGRGYSSHGAHRGRGGFTGGYNHVHEAYAAYSLDNRPKKVAVSGVDFTEPDKDEVLREYLFVLGEFTDIQITPQVTHISFKDRKTAETFMAALKGGSVPGLDGTVAVKWVPSGTPPLVPTKEKETQPASSVDEPRDKDMADEQQAEQEREEDKPDMDYDVADDEDWVG